jgi:prepilin-type processing-associated H-X9-DG protein
MSIMLGEKANPKSANRNQCLTTSTVLNDPETSVGHASQACDYIANCRVFADGEVSNNWTANPAMAENSESTYVIRPAASIQRPAEVAMVWDNALNLNNNPNSIGLPAYPVNLSMENWQNDGPWGTANGWAYPVPYSPTYNGYGRTFMLGGGNAVDGGITSASPGGAPLSGLKYDNVDWIGPNNYGNSTGFGQYQCEMRFRHMKNTTVNILFVDGHVESQVIGQPTAKELCVNVPWPKGM